MNCTNLSKIYVSANHDCVQEERRLSCKFITLKNYLIFTREPFYPHIFCSTKHCEATILLSLSIRMITFIGRHFLCHYIQSLSSNLTFWPLMILYERIPPVKINFAFDRLSFLHFDFWIYVISAV